MDVHHLRSTSSGTQGSIAAGIAGIPDTLVFCLSGLLCGESLPCSLPSFASRSRCQIGEHGTTIQDHDRLGLRAHASTGESRGEVRTDRADTRRGHPPPRNRCLDRFDPCFPAGAGVQKFPHLHCHRGVYCRCDCYRFIPPGMGWWSDRRGWAYHVSCPGALADLSIGILLILPSM